MNSVTKFVTFYSYKGGVGRTSALVNSAILRANKGNRVVVIDFDLEAPGTGSYFKQLDDSYDVNRPGILDYLIEAIDSEEIPSIKGFSYNFSEKIDQTNGGELWVIGAGSVNSHSYYKNLEKIKWSELFEFNNGELLLRNLKKQIEEEFSKPDIVFIDSRTGITETGGVCTRYLADIIVMLTSLNEQNIAGTSEIYRDLRGLPKKFILVASNIPVGFPLQEGQLFGQRLRSFHSAFGADPDVCIYNYPALSLNEMLPVIKVQQDKKTANFYKVIFDTDPLVRSYRSLSSKIERNLDGSSFLSLISTCSWKIVVGLDKDDESFSSLLANFSDRLLTRLLVQLNNFFKNYDSENPTTVDVEEFKSIAQEIHKTSNEKLHNAIRLVRQEIWSDLDRKALREGVPMRKEWETFFEPNSDLHHLTLEEISRGHYSWVIDYLTRFLKKLSKADHWDLAIASFNLAQSLERSKVDPAIDFYRVAAESIDKFVTSLNARSRANTYFCYAIANQRIGKTDLAKKFVPKAIEEAKISPDPEIFSPITYKSVDKETFIAHVEAFAKEFDIV